MIETGRWARIPRDDRHCKCWRIVQTIDHVVLYCEMLKQYNKLDNVTDIESFFNQHSGAHFLRHINVILWWTFDVIYMYVDDNIWTVVLCKVFFRHIFCFSTHKYQMTIIQCNTIQSMRGIYLTMIHWVSVSHWFYTYTDQGLKLCLLQSNNIILDMIEILITQSEKNTPIYWIMSASNNVTRDHQ